MTSSDPPSRPYHLLVYAEPADVVQNLPSRTDHDRPYWDLTSTTDASDEGMIIYFTDGSTLWGSGTIFDVDGERIWFDRLRVGQEAADYPYPIEQIQEGFAYLEDWGVWK
ncbi:hypothetical protein [Halorarius halobius]|uniref:hypothetical protein n=1 Tax=Halorarius halobius TaxID=2962671 RepID=UPI0020CBA3E9|nr:hypothetical protein [Halorarius halobius]